MKTRLYIEEKVHRKIMHFVHKSPVEVSGLGMIEIRDGELWVTDAILLKQVNGPTSTDIDANDVNKALFEFKDHPGDLRFWWHSHVNMGAFWSGTDTATMQQLGKDGWIAATVFNKQGQHKSAIYMENPIGLFLDDVPTEFISRVDVEVVKAWDTEYKSKIKERELVNPLSFGGKWQEDWKNRQYAYSEEGRQGHGQSANEPFSGFNDRSDLVEDDSQGKLFEGSGNVAPTTLDDDIRAAVIETVTMYKDSCLPDDEIVTAIEEEFGIEYARIARVTLYQLDQRGRMARP